MVAGSLIRHHLEPHQGYNPIAFWRELVKGETLLGLFCPPETCGSSSIG
jgi:hypothetical protein